MKKIAVALVALFAMVSLAVASERRDADLDRIQSASTILSQIMSAPDRAIPDSIMSGAKCIAIMPSALKASFVFGANYGKGVAMCRTENGWSAPAFFKLTGGSFGFQAGGQASDLVLIVRTVDGMQHLLHSKFKLGADASAAAGPVGRDAQAMTDLTLRAQVLTYSRSRGLFLGVSLSGGCDQAGPGRYPGFLWQGLELLWAAEWAGAGSAGCRAPVEDGREIRSDTKADCGSGYSRSERANYPANTGSSCDGRGDRGSSSGCNARNSSGEPCGNAGFQLARCARPLRTTRMPQHLLWRRARFLLPQRLRQRTRVKQPGICFPRERWPWPPLFCVRVRLCPPLLPGYHWYSQLAAYPG